MRSVDPSILQGIENPFHAESVEAGLFEAIAQSRSPSTISELAAQADCEPLLVREYIQSFVSLGIAIEQDGTLPTYDRNDAYFEWDTVKSLAQEFSLSEIEVQMMKLFDQIKAFQDQYTADTPDAADSDNTAPGASFTDDVIEWEAARAELRRFERARQILLSGFDSSGFKSETSTW